MEVAAGALSGSSSLGVRLADARRGGEGPEEVLRAASSAGGALDAPAAAGELLVGGRRGAEGPEEVFRAGSPAGGALDAPAVAGELLVGGRRGGGVPCAVPGLEPRCSVPGSGDGAGRGPKGCRLRSDGSGRSDGVSVGLAGSLRRGSMGPPGGSILRGDWLGSWLGLPGIDPVDRQAFQCFWRAK